MKVSLNTVQKLINFDLPPAGELVERINQRLGGVEEVTNLAEKYAGARIVRVVECEKHPDADRLNVTKIDDGGVVEGIERDESGLVQVVCGAPNVHADMWAVWLPPKTTVPASFDDDEPFVLGARPLRGVLSQGMLAAADELAIGSDHDGIIVLTENDLPEGSELTPGASFAEIFALDDTIIDIENKMFTHRPDLFGQIGVAREIAGIYGQEFKSPESYIASPEFASASGLELETFNEATENVPRAMFIALKNIEIKPSPMWLQAALVAMGSKPINNIVDATNYVMLMTAQPTHAYDYDKIRGQKIGARMAQKGEKITLLNDKTYELSTSDIVIADGEGAIGLGGIMGGGDSEVDENTKNIILEVATFDMYAVRKTAMRHGVFTDALTRFNKGQSPLQNDHIMSILLSIISNVSDAEQASDIFDIKKDLVRPQPVNLSAEFINSRLGLQLKADEMRQILSNVELQVAVMGDKLTITPPFWRTDLELPEDVVEEVGRLYGFDKLPRQLPVGSLQPAPQNKLRALKENLRTVLASHGANEVLNYSFVHEKIMQRALQDSTQAFRLTNALSPDLQFYRLSSLPSLLEKIHPNIKAGYDEFTIFELAKAHNKKYHADDDPDSPGLPSEMEFLDIVYSSKKPHVGAPFYVVRALLDDVFSDLNLEVQYQQADKTLDFPLTAPFDLSRCAMVSTTNGEFLGMVGELKQSVLKNFKLPSYTAAASLDTHGILAATTNAKNSYRPLSRFPSVTQDISLTVPVETNYNKVLAELMSSANAELAKLDGEPVAIWSPVSIYPHEDGKTKTVTLRGAFTSYERTLKDDEISQILETAKKHFVGLI